MAFGVYQKRFWRDPEQRAGRMAAPFHISEAFRRGSVLYPLAVKFRHISRSSEIKPIW